MCGIVGITSSKEVTSRIIGSLKKLEYRGYDSAGIATISENNIKGIGAIASKEAAKMYNLSIFASSIQTIKNNVTRFVILNNDGNLISKENINKAALKFILDHQRGSLAAILNVMSDCQLNLTKIQCRFQL